MELSDSAIILLDWLTRRNESPRNISDFTRETWELDYDDTSGLVQQLERRGLVQDETTFGGVDARVTGEGMALMERIRRERANPSSRVKALRKEMLTWLYRREQKGDDASSWYEFLEDADARFLADRFKIAETHSQAEYLWNRGLIASVSIEEASNGSVNPRLTPEGYDCIIEFGGNVSDYLNRGAAGSSVNNYNIADNRGNFSIGGQDFTQNANSGVDTSELLKFAGAVRQMLPTLGLSESDVTVLDQQAEELHLVASEPEPPVGKLRSLWAAIMEGIGQAAPTVAQELVTNLGNEAIKAIGAG